MGKIKIMIKVCIYIIALFFITFYLAPSSKVFASFTDSASLNAGLNLTLGNLDLSTEQNETTTGLTYLGGNPVLLSSHVLKNKGTLDGKLAYKIQVTEKGTAIPVNDSETQLIINFDSVIGDKIVPAAKINLNSYTFVTDNKNNEWIFNGNQKKDAPVTIQYKSTNIPERDHDIDITVTFLLVQNNASEPKETMFYDKVSFKHELKLKAEDIPNPNYWPAADDKNWKWNWNGKDKVRYNDAQFENIMYFSELESGDKVRNLNDNVLYIELPEGNLKEDNNFRIDQPEGYKIETEVMENRRFIKVTFSFDLSNKKAESLLTQPRYYKVDFHYEGSEPNAYAKFDSTLLPLVQKRILLNTDEKISNEFKILPIYTTLNQKKLTFKHTSLGDNWNGNNLNNHLVDASLSYKNLYAEVVEEPTLFNLSLHKASQSDNQDYLLINTSKAATESDKTNKGKLKIILIGNNGNRLVIYRDLYTTNETKVTKQSRIIKQENSSSMIEATENDVVEAPVETKEAAEQEELIQATVSEEITTSDSSIEFSEESVQEDQENDSALENDAQKDEATKDSNTE